MICLPIQIRFGYNISTVLLDTKLNELVSKIDEINNGCRGAIVFFDYVQLEICNFLQDWLYMRPLLWTNVPASIANIPQGSVHVNLKVFDIGGTMRRFATHYGSHDRWVWLNVFIRHLSRQKFLQRVVVSVVHDVWTAHWVTMGNAHIRSSRRPRYRWA